MLTLSLTTVIIAVTILTTNTLIDEKAREAADIFAQNLANKVANAIVNICVLKEQYPNVNYTSLLDLPYKLVDRFSYYIEINNNDVYVKSYDGSIVEKSTIYNVTEEQATTVSGRIDGSGGVLNISCNSYDYIYRFDFGTNTSTRTTGYTRVTNMSNNNNWNVTGNLNDWKYRTPIIIKNPVGKTLVNYQVLIQLDDNNFDYSLVNTNGSDLRFVNKTGKMLNYWIERWYPRDTHTSRIWVNLNLSYPEDIIYMYHGNVSATSLSNGNATFSFFDDFSTTLSPTKWYQYRPGNKGINITNGELVLTNGAAINSTIQFGATPCVIETKAKTNGTLREASMFAKNDGSTTCPYDYAYIFTSGNFATVNKNLSIVKNNVLPPNNSSGLPVNQGWNRLTYIINGTDVIVCRYFYENYTVDGALNDIATYSGNGYFGLCTTVSNTFAKYDWIFVRKFEANVSESVTNKEESIPIAYVCGTDSLNYSWSTNNVISKEYNSQSIIYNYICNLTNSAATFKITNLTGYLGDDDCSLIFTVGDPQSIVEGMTLTINGVVFDVPNCEYSYKKLLITNIVPSPVEGGSLEIIFNDNTPISYYWSVGDLSIQHGKRIIDISGGR